MATAAAIQDEITREDYAAVEKVLRSIDGRNSQRASLETFANWKMGFKLYRDLEFQYIKTANRAALEQGHRAVLTSLLAVTEVLSLSVGNHEADELARISLSRETFDACLRYLRRKYNGWFAPIDPTLIDLLNRRLAAQ